MRRSSARTFVVDAALPAGVFAVLCLVSCGGGPAAVPAGDAPKDKPPVQVTPPPTTSIDLVDRSLRELDWGTIAFNASATMRYAQQQPVELLLSPSLGLADLQSQLQQKMGAESARVRISNRMEAQLTGRGFAIGALTPDLQAVTSEQVTRWKWEVTPTEAGRQALHLVLSARIDVAGHDAPLVVRTFDHTIDVDITVPQRISGFVGNNWQWLWAAIVGPIAGYAWSRRKTRRSAPRRSAV